ncbi:PREDICTED: fibrocystin-L-like [Branchiostoma belcheri]|uniref:Fibrocystin-L-like n=1 Tax=Branchiostoma belcheri TaxID=7741 RepID=A0A6P4Z1C7_BRABE|nr:PREDICTED: fibrocystin-L-like [Branchiostoma belcheri]
MAVSRRYAAAAWSVWILLVLVQDVLGQTPRVTSIGSHQGSRAGETQLYIYGEGFSANQFSWGEGNENAGNRVLLEHDSGTFSVVCAVEADMSNQQQIVCRTPAVENDGTYYARVTVDGVPIPVNKHCRYTYDYRCRFTYKGGRTPTIASLSPISAPPGSFVRVRGTIFTTKYGSNVDKSTNGKTATIKRVYFGGQKCELRDFEADEMSSADGDTKRVSVVVNDRNLHMFQTYAEVLGVSPATGSLAGGTRLTITGRYFDDTDAPPEVYVGGTPCAVQSMTDNTIECITQAAPDLSSPSWPGNRGMQFEQWNNTRVNWGNIAGVTDYTSSRSGYWTKWISNFEFHDTHNQQHFVTRASGYFVPPEDDWYQFYIRSDDQSILYMSKNANKENKTRIAYCDRYRPGWFNSNSQKSEKMWLEKGKSYYMETSQAEQIGGAFYEVAVRKFTTQYTSQQTDSAWMAQQRVAVSVASRREKQRVTLGNFATASPVKQVQTITFVGSVFQYKLGFDGASTGLLLSSGDPNSVKTALNNLMSVQPDTVEVTQSNTADGFELAVEFQSTRGNFPPFEVDISGGNATVAVTTEGRPALDTFTLDMGGVPSDPIAHDASAEDVKNAVLSALGSRCPSDIVAPSGSIKGFLQDYEGNIGYSLHGQKVTNVEAFCGRAAEKNPVYLFRENFGVGQLRMDMYRKTCFAYKGTLGLSDKIWVTFTFTDSSRNQQQKNRHYSVGLQNDGAWHYICVDLYGLVSSDEVAVGGRSFMLKEFGMVWENQGAAVYVDTVFIGRVNTVDNPEEMTGLRVPGAKLNGMAITDVLVEKDQNSTAYDITLVPHGCDYGFPLLSVRSAQVTSDTVNGTVYTYPSTSTAVTVKRLAAATPPLGGTFDVSFKDNVVPDIPSDVSASAFKNLLEQVGGTGKLSVSREGSCSGYTWTVGWTSVGGDQPKLLVNTSGLTGEDVSATVTETREGGLFISPVTGDFLRTVHDKPQVQVTINHVPSACAGNCTFEWTADSTPSVNGVNPSEGSFHAGTSITISGSGFLPNTDNNTVTIGGVACEITAATEDEISCDVQENSGGSHVVTVEVDGKGLASHPNSTSMFTYTADISNISPTSGSLGGGMQLTISGHGFGQDYVPYVGGQPCAVVNITYTDITCTTPSTSSAGNATVTVYQGGNQTLTSPTDFEYDSASTPTVTALSSSLGTVNGGDVIVISGTSFGSTASSDDAVKIGDAAAEILSYNDTDVIISLPAQGPGLYPVTLFVSGGGFADVKTNNISGIRYALKVTNVVPRSGSYLGGTRVTIVGEGFSTDNTTVAFGDVSCDVTSVNYTHIECVTASLAKVHEVDNMGSHPTYGRGYAWSHTPLDVHPGDTVRWKWNTPGSATGVGYLVQQTASADDTNYDGRGFRSGTVKTRSGVFEHVFTGEGLYFYSSGPVDRNGNVKMKGVVNVVPYSGSVQQLSLAVNGYEAEYDVNSGVADPVDSTACAGETSQISGCTSAAPQAPSGDDKFFFTFDPCRTPRITSISPLSGTMRDVITVNASGLGSDSCMNKVTVGGYPCSCELVTADSLSCTIDHQVDMPVATYNNMGLTVDNRGDGLNSPLTVEERSFVLLPNVDSISPDVGSMVGGTLVTITGYGFTSPGIDASDIDIRIGALKCPVIELTYNQIVCETAPISQNKRSASSEIERDISITMSTGGGPVNFACSSGNCSFTYSESATPKVTDVQPKEVSGAVTQLAINGSLFGTDPSMVSVAVDGDDVSCNITTITDGYIECDLGPVRVGVKSFSVHVRGKGTADSSVSSLESLATIDDVTPSEGSVNGGNTVTITGNGFVPGNTAVLIGGESCDIRNITRLQIDCVAPHGVEGEALLRVTSDSVQYPQQRYNYSVDNTAEVSGVSPSAGKTGDTITITGSKFGSDSGDVTVTIDGVECSITTFSSSSIECTVGHHSAGTYEVIVFLSGRGLATSSLEFEYQLSVTSISPAEGSFGGGQVLTIDGTGFDPELTVVTVCNKTCEPTAPPQPSQLTCKVPANEDVSSGTLACDVTVSVGAESVQQNAAYTYRSSLTPVITEVSPRRGGTAGGTTVTITGTGFGATAADNSVTIAGSECIIQTASTTQIVCVTEAHQGSAKTKVRVAVDDQGIATQDDADYWYIDRWSSVFTWGGGPLPEAGDFVIVPAGQTLLLDTDTPVLKMLLIEGGELIFDEQNVELQAENILITGGGLLQVGTEDEPFQHKAIITMHGHVRSPELPLYGAKTLAVREGTLDLHGKPTPVTWTFLADSVSPGDTTLTLTQSINWEVGDQIVLATTGHRHTQRQNEVRTIASVSGDGRTVTITEGLQYRHISAVTTFADAGVTLETRCEVGLLTHNVVVRGSNHREWNDIIPNCPAGFDTGEFATQTCFQGRFGEEVGTDEFGSHIILHGREMNKGLVLGRLSHIEVTHAGQAYRHGRYAIHFHINGNMNGSYVRGCSIHKSFNRAVNVHHVHELLVERNVFYNIMGGAMFLEDGIETNNVFQYNLGVFVKSSTSLLNDDITPAAYWVTNPNNIFRHNHAAGGTHFGFWYRMHKHPDGPSFDSSICPQRIPVGEFYNNTVHSQGWFGIWIFQDYFPTENGACSGRPVPAKFYKLISWNNEKGAEWVNCGAIQFIDFVMANNEKAGIEMKMVKGTEWGEERGAMIKDGYMIGYVDALAETASTQCTTAGLVLPLSNKLTVSGTDFINFDRSSCACLAWAKIDGTSGDNNGGWTYRTERLLFHDAPNQVRFRWEHEAVVYDMDGSLTGKADGKVTPHNPALPPECVQNSAYSVGQPGSKCEPSVNFIRFSWNLATPATLRYKNVLFSSPYGTTVVPYRRKRMTHKEGWMAILQTGVNHNLVYENVDHVTNISYTGIFYQLPPDQYTIVYHNFTQKPDKFAIIPGQETEGSINPVTFEDNQYGDWYFDVNTKFFYYMISGKTSSRKKRAVPTSYTDRAVQLRVYRCFFKDCIPPPPPPVDNSSTPVDIHIARERPATFQRWSDAATWEGTEDGWGGNFGSSRKKRQVYGAPADGANVKILSDKWIVADVERISLNKLFIYGVLELDDGPDKNYVFSAVQILVQGGRLIIGWEDNPFQGMIQIILKGNHQTPDIPLPNGPNMGSKALGCFGGCDIHGKNRVVTFTRLAQTGNVGDSTITLVKAVDWVAGDDIAIATTTFDVWQTETFRIVSVSEDTKTITLNGTLMYKHLGETLTLADNQTINMAAEVALLTRNVKIIGEDYDELFGESFGARVIVGTFFQDGVQYLGYGRFENVEFYHTGQEGWIDFYDPRYSLAFLDVGEILDDYTESYIRKNTFHSGFSPAIGVFGTQNLNIDDNVIHHTVGQAMRVWGVDNKLRRNLVSLIIWPGSYQDRVEPENVDWTAAIEVFEATSIVLQGNVVAGSERVGFHIDGEVCSGGTAEAWSNNVAHSCMVGVAGFPPDGLNPCTKISGFTVWKNHDYGIYFQSGVKELVVENLLAADNQVGVFLMLIGPGSSGHKAVAKSMTIRNSHVVGTTPFFDCNTDVTPPDDNYKIGSQSRGWSRPGGGKVGISLPLFSSGGNNARVKPFNGEMAYSALYGIMHIRDVAFSNFGPSCAGEDVILMTNPKQEDAGFPTKLSGITLHGIAEKNKAFFLRPSVGKINPADCVDMECDAKKETLIDDEDGSFLGSVGTVIPEAEFEWDGDRRRGLGDYRIPKMMLTDTQGRRLDVNVVAPNKGIVRDDSCTYKSDWQAWKCHDIDYEMLIIESMDADTELRRLSPVALHTGQYVDLVNGPQDHGWCAGYTCQKRLSTFWTVVGLGRHYEIYFTGTSPQKLRLHLMNAKPDQSMRLGIYYANPQRLDIYTGGRYIMPENGAYNDAGQLILLEPETEGQYYPAIDGASGSNFFDRPWQRLYLTIKGSEPIDIKTSPVLYVTFGVPAITVDDFFEVNLRANLAAYLNIPASKIRVVNVVREDSKRKKRDGTTNVEIEITEPPANDTSTAEGVEEESRSDLQVAASTIVDSTQLGTLGDEIGIQITSLEIVEPLPPPNSTAWEEVVQEDPETASQAVSVQIPTRMELHTQPEPQHEGSEFPVQPKLQVFDGAGNVVMKLGTLASPWEVQATIRTGSGSDSRAQIIGDNAVFTNGWANFTNLAISHSGQGYIIDFIIVKPQNASSFRAASSAVEVASRPLSGKVFPITGNMTVNEPFTLTVGITDAVTGLEIQDIAWKGHTWTCSVELYKPFPQDGDLTGSTTVNFDPFTGRATFTSMAVTQLSQYFFKFNIRSSPSGYDVMVESEPITFLPADYVTPDEEDSAHVTMRFSGDYQQVAAGKEGYLGSALWVHIMDTYTDVTVGNFSFSEGSVVAEFDMKGTTSGVNNTLVGLWNEVKDGLTLTVGGNTLQAQTSMLVDGQDYYGMDGAPPAAPAAAFPVGAIIGVVVVVIIVAALIGGFFYLKKRKQSRSKTLPVEEDSVVKPGSSGDSESGLGSDNGSYIETIEMGEDIKKPPVELPPLTSSNPQHFGRGDREVLPPIQNPPTSRPASAASLRPSTAGSLQTYRPGGARSGMPDVEVTGMRTTAFTLPGATPRGSVDLGYGDGRVPVEIIAKDHNSRFVKVGLHAVNKAGSLEELRGELQQGFPMLRTGHFLFLNGTMTDVMPQAREEYTDVKDMGDGPILLKLY